MYIRNKYIRHSAMIRAIILGLIIVPWEIPVLLAITTIIAFF